MSAMALDLPHHPQPAHQLRRDEDELDDFEDASFSATTVAPSTLFQPPQSQTNEAAAPSSKAPPPAAASETKIDHRKKRRNRTTQSCLSCHQNKRKCDRGRPCGRCITLGLTGFCVYEVGERNRTGEKDGDQVNALRSRVAELEGVVRELKNKPQPRWAASALTTTGTGNPSSSSSSSNAPLAPPLPPPTPVPEVETPRMGGPNGASSMSFPKESWHVRSARKDRSGNNAATSSSNDLPPAPPHSSTSDPTRDREAERNATHAVHNTLNAFLDRENSVDFSASGTGATGPMFTYPNPATSWKSYSAGGKGKGVANGDGFDFGNDYAPQQPQPPTPVPQNQGQSYGVQGDLASPFSPTTQQGGAGFAAQQMRRPSTGLGFVSSNGVTSATATTPTSQSFQHTTPRFPPSTPLPSSSSLPQQQQQQKPVHMGIIGSGLAGLSAGAAGRQRSLTGPPPSISARRAMHAGYAQSPLGGGVGGGVYHAPGSNSLNTFLHPPPPPRKVVAPGGPSSLHSHSHSSSHGAAGGSPVQSCSCLAPRSGAEGEENGAANNEAFVKNLLANVREVAAFLETLHPSGPGLGDGADGGEGMGEGQGGEAKKFGENVKLVGECAVVRCLNQLDRAIRISHNAGRRFAHPQNPSSPTSTLSAHPSSSNTASSAPSSPHNTTSTSATSSSSQQANVVTGGVGPHRSAKMVSRPSVGGRSVSHSAAMHHQHQVQQQVQQQQAYEVPPPLTPPPHLGYLSPARSDSALLHPHSHSSIPQHQHAQSTPALQHHHIPLPPPTPRHSQSHSHHQPQPQTPQPQQRSQSQIELDMGLLEAQQAAQLEEIQMAQAREREEVRLRLIERQHHEQQAQQAHQSQQHGQMQGYEPEMEWTMHESSQQQHGAEGDAPSPIELISQEALDALRGAEEHQQHHAQQQQQQQRMSIQYASPVSYTPSNNNNGGNERRPSAISLHNVNASTNASASGSQSLPGSRRGSSHSVLILDPSSQSQSTASSSVPVDDGTFAFGGYEVEDYTEQSQAVGEEGMYGEYAVQQEGGAGAEQQVHGHQQEGEYVGASGPGGEYEAYFGGEDGYYA